MGMVPDRSGRSDVALQGAIESFGIARVLQYLSLEPNAARLHVTGDLGSMNVWLADGSLVVPWTDEGDEPSLRPAETVFRLLRFASGTFTVVDEPVPSGTVARQPFAEALSSAHAMLAEWPELQRIVLGPDATVTLARRLPNGGFDLAADDWKVLALVAGGTTVRSLVRRLGLGQFDGLRCIAALVRGGLVDIQLPPATTQTSEQGPAAVETASQAPLVARKRSTPAPIVAAPVAAAPVAAAAHAANEETIVRPLPFDDRRKEVVVDSWTGQPVAPAEHPEPDEDNVGALRQAAAKLASPLASQLAGPAHAPLPHVAAPMPKRTAPPAPPAEAPTLTGNDPALDRREVRRPATAVARLATPGGPAPASAPTQSPPATPTPARAATERASVPAAVQASAQAAVQASARAEAPVTATPTSTPVAERQVPATNGVRGSIPASLPKDGDARGAGASTVAKRPEELIAAAMAARLAEDRADRSIDAEGDTTAGDDALNRALLYKFLSSVRS